MKLFYVQATYDKSLVTPKLLILLFRRGVSGSEIPAMDIDIICSNNFLISLLVTVL